MAEKLTTSWMWGVDSGGVNGANIDIDRQQIHWFDSVGCACGDSSAVQTFGDFREKGSPLGHLDDDIYKEMMTTLAQVERHHNDA